MAWLHNSSSSSNREGAEAIKRGLLTTVALGVFNLMFSTFRSFTGVQASIVSCIAVIAALVAACSYGTLIALALARYYAPATANYVRPLHFDYSTPIASAVAPLGPNLAEQHTIKVQHLPEVIGKNRFLPKGQQVAVYVHLQLPATHTELFQVTGELVAQDGHVAARSSRAYMLHSQPPAYRAVRQLLLSPLYFLGLYQDAVTVKLRMFDKYEEKENLPVTQVRVYLTARNSSSGVLPPPPVFKADVHIRLLLGWLRSLLLMLRPGLTVTIILGGSALLLGLGSTATALLLFAVAFFLHNWSKAPAPKSLPERVDYMPYRPTLALPGPQSRHFDTASTADTDLPGASTDEDFSRDEIEHSRTGLLRRWRSNAMFAGAADSDTEGAGTRREDWGTIHDADSVRSSSIRSGTTGRSKSAAAAPAAADDTPANSRAATPTGEAEATTTEPAATAGSPSGSADSGGAFAAVARALSNEPSDVRLHGEVQEDKDTVHIIRDKDNLRANDLGNGVNRRNGFAWQR